MRRLAVVPALLALLLLLFQPPSAGAQVPIDPPPLEETVEEVVQTTEDVVATAEDVVQQSAEPVASETVQETESATTAAAGAVGSAGGGGGGTPTTSGGTASSPTGAPSAGSGGEGKGQARKPRGSANRKPPRGDPRPPRPNPADRIRGLPAAAPLVVTKSNDADGDFAFGSAETAPKPGASVAFQVSILNQAARDVTLGAVIDYFPRGEGIEEILVCNEVTGQILAPGESVTCAFTLDAYSADRGERVINTVRVQGTVNHNGNTVSASGASTVITAGGEVLGVIIERPEESGLASTGAAILQLLYLTVILGWTGGAFMVAGRRGGRHVQGRVGSDATSIRFGVVSVHAVRRDF